MEMRLCGEATEFSSQLENAQPSELQIITFLIQIHVEQFSHSGFRRASLGFLGADLLQRAARFSVPQARIKNLTHLKYVPF